MSNNPKQPKKLELTEPAPRKPEEGGEGAPLPVSIELNQKRSQHNQNFENSLRQARIELIKSIQRKRGSKVFVFYSHDTLDAQHAEIFFELLQEVGKQEKLDLFLLSPGGFADQAFNMSRWCREYATQFNVIIPYYAKSAATLLSLGADTLLMGPSSELGPIDPQIRIPDEYGQTMQVSALSIKDALKVIEGLTEDNQEKALKYMPLIEKIDLKVLGQYDRAIQSAKQYASDLLHASGLLNDKDIEEADVNDSKKKVPKHKNIAHQLTEGYYSHGYAIGTDKARELGFNVVCPGDTSFDPEVWKSVWRLHKFYDDMMRNNRNERLLTENLVEYRQVITVLETDAFSVPIEKNFIKDLSQRYGKK
jgi:hypothetical protein